MLQFKGLFGVNGRADGLPDDRAVGIGDIGVHPVSARPFGAGDELFPDQALHLTPIGTHLVHDVRCDGDESAIPRIRFPEGRLHPGSFLRFPVPGNNDGGRMGQRGCQLHHTQGGFTRIFEIPRKRAQNRPSEGSHRK